MLTVKYTINYKLLNSCKIYAGDHIMNRLEQNTLEQNVWYDELVKLGEMWGKPTSTALADEVEELEQHRIRDALELSKGDKTHAANFLGIGRTLLLHKMKKYELDK